MSTELAISDRASLVPLIAQAMQSDVDPAKLRALLDVRQAWESDEARKLFSASITEFQRRAPIVAKDDEAYGKKYARLDRIWRTIRPLLTDLGLSVTWQCCELRGTVCHVEGMLRHSAGHGERITQDIPMPELLKGQNAAQQMGSAETYAKRYALCGALGIVTGDDDDGEAAGTCYVSQDQANEVSDLLDVCRGISGFSKDAFWRWLGIHDESMRNPLNIHLARHAECVAMLKRKASSK